MTEPIGTAQSNTHVQRFFGWWRNAWRQERDFFLGPDYQTAYEATRDALETVCEEFGATVEWDSELLPSLALRPHAIPVFVCGHCGHTAQFSGGFQPCPECGEMKWAEEGSQWEPSHQ